MINLYRITPEIYIENYTGRGGSFLNGARWNTKGSPALYFALSPSVAMLEMANYLPSPRLVPKTYRLGIYTMPKDQVEKLDLTILPKDWAQYPYPKSTQEIGSRWLAKAKKLAYVVPSAATPGGRESIALINPLHPKANKIKLVDVQSELFNERAFMGLN